jgi:hypothetical protein
MEIRYETKESVNPPVVAGSTATSAGKIVPLKSKPRVTIDLPTNFSEGDADRDGQIGLYEWRSWKRGSMTEFAQFDRNGDGFLTPEELVRGPSGTLAASNSSPRAAPSVAAPDPTVPQPGIPSTPTPMPAVASSSPQSNATPAAAPAGGDPAGEVAVRRAESLFRIMDRNRDGTLDSAEWMSSNRLRPQFEAAGVDLKQPMSRDVFVQHYLKLNSSNS